MPPNPRKKADCPGCGNYRQIDGRGLCGTCYRRVRETEDPSLREARLARDKERSHRYYEANREMVLERIRANEAHRVKRPRRPRVVKLKAAPPMGEELVVTSRSGPTFTVASVCRACDNRWSDHGLCRLKLEHEKRMSEI